MYTAEDLWTPSTLLEQHKSTRASDIAGSIDSAIDTASCSSKSVEELHEHPHVVFDLSRNRSCVLPSHKHIKKALAQLSTSPGRDHEVEPHHLISLLSLDTAPVEISSVQLSHLPPPHKGILKVTKNPHICNERQNLSRAYTLNMRMSEQELRLKEAAVEQAQADKLDEEEEMFSMPSLDERSEDSDDPSHSSNFATHHHRVKKRHSSNHGKKRPSIHY